MWFVNFVLHLIGGFFPVLMHALHLVRDIGVQFVGRHAVQDICGGVRQVRTVGECLLAEQVAVRVQLFHLAEDVHLTVFTTGEVLRGGLAFLREIVAALDFEGALIGERVKKHAPFVQNVFGESEDLGKEARG
jgi:hypothetical protein